jgi:hypothetical protein
MWKPFLWRKLFRVDMHWDWRNKGAFDIRLVWYVNIVEGAISETSKVWQLDMFEQKSNGGHSCIVRTSKLFLKPFLLSVYRVVAMRRTSPGTTDFRKNKHGFIDCQPAKYAKVALLLFAFSALFRWNSLDTSTDICGATATVLKGLWATQTSFRSNLFYVPSVAQPSAPPQRNSKFRLKLWLSYADLLLTRLLSRFWVKRDAIRQNTLRVPCWIRIKITKYTLTVKLYFGVPARIYTLEFLQESDSFPQGTQITFLFGVFRTFLHFQIAYTLRQE